MLPPGSKRRDGAYLSPGVGGGSRGEGKAERLGGFRDWPEGRKLRVPCGYCMPDTIAPALCFTLTGPNPLPVSPKSRKL